MKPFWRDTDLTEIETQLLDALFEAHSQCARRNNISTAAVVGSALGSCDYGKAIACGLLSIGHLHGPIAQCMKLLKIDNTQKNYAECIALCIKDGKKVPGWGSSFGKETAFDRVAELLTLLDGTLGDKIDSITQQLHAAGKGIYPNPGCYTAAAALVLGVPAHAATALFLMGRLNVWTRLFLETAQPSALWE